MWQWLWTILIEPINLNQFSLLLEVLKNECSVTRESLLQERPVAVERDSHLNWDVIKTSDLWQMLWKCRNMNTLLGIRKGPETSASLASGLSCPWGLCFLSTIFLSIPVLQGSDFNISFLFWSCSFPFLMISPSFLPLSTVSTFRQCLLPGASESHV